MTLTAAPREEDQGRDPEPFAGVGRGLRWWRRTDASRIRRRSADHSRLGAALQRPRTGRAGRAPGAPSKADHRRALAEVVEASCAGGARTWRGGSWRRSHLARRATVGRELKLGFAKISARPRHYAQNELAVEAFKKTSPPNWRRSGGSRKASRELWWQDEARIGQKNKLTRRGPDVARARGRPATSAPNGPISLSREGERRRAGQHRRHGGAPHRDQCRRRSRRPCQIYNDVSIEDRMICANILQDRYNKLARQPRRCPWHLCPTRLPSGTAD